jgi:hypothetical protein
MNANELHGHQSFQGEELDNARNVSGMSILNYFTDYSKIQVKK